MGKNYLQEYITPKANEYIAVGEDGNLTSSDLRAYGACPKILIEYEDFLTRNTNGTVTLEGAWTATCLLNNVTVPVTYSYSDESIVCYPTYFGPWEISVTDEGNTETSTSFYVWTSNGFDSTATSEISSLTLYKTTESDFN